MEKQKPYIGFSPAPLLFHLKDINTITDIYHYNKELEYDEILQTNRIEFPKPPFFVQKI